MVFGFPKLVVLSSIAAASVYAQGDSYGAGDDSLLFDTPPFFVDDDSSGSPPLFGGGVGGDPLAGFLPPGMNLFSPPSGGGGSPSPPIGGSPAASYDSDAIARSLNIEEGTCEAIFISADSGFDYVIGHPACGVQDCEADQDSVEREQDGDLVILTGSVTCSGFPMSFGIIDARACDDPTDCGMPFVSEPCAVVGTTASAVLCLEIGPPSAGSTGGGGSPVITASPGSLPPIGGGPPSAPGTPYDADAIARSLNIEEGTCELVEFAADGSLPFEVGHPSCGIDYSACAFDADSVVTEEKGDVVILTRSGVCSGVPVNSAAVDARLCEAGADCGTKPQSQVCTVENGVAYASLCLGMDTLGAFSSGGDDVGDGGGVDFGGDVSPGGGTGGDLFPGGGTGGTGGDLFPVGGTEGGGGAGGGVTAPTDSGSAEDEESVSTTKTESPENDQRARAMGIEEGTCRTAIFVAEDGLEYDVNDITCGVDYQSCTPSTGGASPETLQPSKETKESIVYSKSTLTCSGVSVELTTIDARECTDGVECGRAPSSKPCSESGGVVEATICLGIDRLDGTFESSSTLGHRLASATLLLVGITSAILSLSW